MDTTDCCASWYALNRVENEKCSSMLPVIQAREIFLPTLNMTAWHTCSFSSICDCTSEEHTPNNSTNLQTDMPTSFDSSLGHTNIDDITLFISGEVIATFMQHGTWECIIPEYLLYSFTYTVVVLAPLCSSLELGCGMLVY